MPLPETIALIVGGCLVLLGFLMVLTGILRKEPPSPPQRWGSDD